MARAYVEVAPGLYRVPHLGDFLNSFIVCEEDSSVTLIDCGLSNGPRRIIRALEDLGRHPEDVQRVVLTHAHSDHAGGAAEIIRTTNAKGANAHDDDASYLSTGRAPDINASPLVGVVLDRVQTGSFDPVPLALSIADGDLLPVGGGMRVIHTPGHTPGHVSLLFEAKEVLVTGDCILNPLGMRIWPFGPYCVSPAQNAASAALLADLEFAVAAFTHGPPIKDRPREKIRHFLMRKGAIAP